MKNLSSEIIKEIEKRNVRPAPRSHYALRKSLCWSAAFFLVLVCAAVIALTIYLLQSLDWSTYQALGYTSAHAYLMRVFPYALIFLLAVFLIGAYFLYRQTPKGHKASLGILLAGLIVLAFILAGALHLIGASREAHFRLAHMRWYHHMVHTKEREWSQPEKGLLWGKVLSIDGESFVLRDFYNRDWKIDGPASTQISNDESLAGKNVKIIGEKTGNNEFRASSIQPWDGIMDCEGRRSMMMGRRMHVSVAPW